MKKAIKIIAYLFYGSLLILGIFMLSIYAGLLDIHPETGHIEEIGFSIGFIFLGACGVFHVRTPTTGSRYLLFAMAISGILMHAIPYSVRTNATDPISAKDLMILTIMSAISLYLFYGAYKHLKKKH